MRKKEILFLTSNIILFILFLILIMFHSSKASAQTSFSAVGLPIAENTWNGSQSVTIPVSGLSTLTDGVLELIQVNVELKVSGSGMSTSVSYSLTSPSGTTIVFKQAGYDGPSSINHFDFKFRDPPSHGGCDYLENVHDLTGMSLAEPWSTGYHRPHISGSFDNVNGENPNGNWVMNFAETSSFTEPEITKIELIFGNLEVVDITSSTANDNCSTPQAFCDEYPICYNNISHTGDASSDPEVGNSGFCDWNLSQDNTGWFYWIATSTTAHIEVSGVSTNQQIIAVGNSTGSASCNSNDLYVLTGGCPTAPQNYNPTYSNGDNHNMELNISGLTIGETYYFIVDGEGGAHTLAYLTIDGASDCTPLPIKLIDFYGINNNGINELYWVTASEINNNFFTIERSIDAKNWEAIKFIYAAGNSNTRINYSYFDDSYYSETNYYRLKQTDYDGKSSYSKSISISSNKNYDNIKIYPSPAKNYITITGTTENTLMNIYSSDGIKIKNIKTENYSTRIDVNSFPNGIYILEIINNNGDISSHKFQVIK